MGGDPHPDRGKVTPPAPAPPRGSLPAPLPLQVPATPACSCLQNVPLMGLSGLREMSLGLGKQPLHTLRKTRLHDQNKTEMKNHWQQRNSLMVGMDEAAGAPPLPLHFLFASHTGGSGLDTQTLMISSP